MGRAPHELDRALESASPEVRALVEALLADGGLARTRALDAIKELAQRGGAALDEALPLLLQLATRPRYSEGSALLVRLYTILAAIDDPPRSGRPSGAAGPRWDRFRESAPRLVHHARRARDPEGARVAALIAARFEEHDAELVPVLIALASGARDADDRARFVYALTRSQATRGAPFSPLVARALHGASGPEATAAALALAEHDPTEPLRGRLAKTLLEARDALPIPDPRAWGRTLDPSALDRALALLAPTRPT